MGDVIFEVEYIDRATGEVVRTRVREHGLARRMARELAKASGRRAIIRRVCPESSALWSVHLADARTGDIECVWNGLTKREVLLRWKLWSERQTQCVLVAWPEWMPALGMSLEAAA